jgi:hypothetical protein
VVATEIRFLLFNVAFMGTVKVVRLIFLVGTFSVSRKLSVDFGGKEVDEGDGCETFEVGLDRRVSRSMTGDGEGAGDREGEFLDFLFEFP